MSNTTTYAAFNGDAIWGTGATPEAALANVAEWIDMDDEKNAGFVDELDTAVMTPALAAAVESHGGNISFGKLPDGRVGTYDEHYAAA